MTTVPSSSLTVTEGRRKSAEALIQIERLKKNTGIGRFRPFIPGNHHSRELHFASFFLSSPRRDKKGLSILSSEKWCFDSLQITYISVVGKSLMTQPVRDHVLRQCED